MGGKGMLRSGVAALMLLLVSVPYVGAIQLLKAPDTSNGSDLQLTGSVTVDEAKEIAKIFLKKVSAMREFESWKEVNISGPIITYGPDERKSAYIFELERNGEYAGYVVISAQRSNYPILEFSKGKSPMRQAAELGLKVEKLYRTGGLSYIYETAGKRHFKQNGKEVNLSEVKKSIKKASEDERVKKHLTERAKKARNVWKAYSGTTSGKSTGATTQNLYGDIVLGVPAFLWDDGCSPTSAAMVLEYHGEHGYPNLDLPDRWYTEASDEGDSNGYDDPNNEHTDLTEELHVAMGTDDNTGSTLPWKIDDGINRVVQNHGYSNNWASNDYYVSWSEVIAEIWLNRPFVLSMDNGGTGSGHDTPYGDHSVAVVGYAEDSSTGERYLVLHDTWDKQSHYLAFGDWLAAMATWVRPS